MENKLQTDKGQHTPLEIIDYLTYVSYKTNRNLGCSHEGLLNIGLGNEAMKQRYDIEKAGIKLN